MKNQYFGDVNDFQKYGLLRAIARKSGLRLGILWYLTIDDGSNDGGKRTFTECHRKLDFELCERLESVIRAETNRTVGLAEDWNLISNATYFKSVVPADRVQRTEFFAQARSTLSNCDLIFVDPDNGIEVPSMALGRTNSVKYTYWHELEALFAAGHSLLIYQHFRRVKRDDFMREVASELRHKLKAEVVGLRTAHVGFFLAKQPGHIRHFSPVIEEIDLKWTGQIWRVDC